MSSYNYYIENAIKDLAQNPRLRDVEPFVLIAVLDGRPIKILLSTSYTFTLDDYRTARSYVGPGDAIVLVDRSAGATGEVENRAKADGIFVGSVDEIFNRL